MLLYKKKIQYIPGTVSRKVSEQIYSENKRSSDDAKNRKYVSEKIKKLIKEGMSEEKIIEEILKDEVMKNFEYLKAINSDTRVVVENWVKDAIKRGNKREEQER